MHLSKWKRCAKRFFNMLLCSPSASSVSTLNVNESDVRHLSTINDLFYAVRAARVDLVEHLLHNKRLSTRAHIQRTSILSLAVTRNSQDIVKLLLLKGADVNQMCEHLPGTLETPLFTAAKLGHTQIVVDLLKHGANPNLADLANRTPLYIAVKFNREDVCQILIAAGANLNTADTNGVTPLHIASRSFGREMILLHLLNHGAYVEQADFKGRQPIDSAASSGNSCSVDMLLDAGSSAGKVIQDRINEWNAHPDDNHEQDHVDFCAQKAEQAKRRVLPLMLLATRQVRNMMTAKEKTCKTGKSIWVAIDDLPIPEHLKIDIKVHVCIDGFDC